MKHPDQESLSCLMDGEWRELDVRRCVEAACRDEALRAKWSRYHLARDAMRREVTAGGGVSMVERIRSRLADEPAHTNVTVMFDGVGTGAEFGGADARGAAPAAASGAESAPIDSPGARTAASAPAPGPAAPGPAAAGARPAAPSRRVRWSGLFGGAALAASVALATVFGLDALRGGALSVDGDEETLRVASLPASPPAPPLVAASGDARDGFSRQIAGVPLPEVDLVANSGNGADAGTGAYWTLPGESARRADSEARLNLFLSQHIEHSPAAEHQGMLPYSRLVGYDERAAER